VWGLALVRPSGVSQPQHVVMYDPDLAFLRELEVFNASRAAAIATAGEEEAGALRVHFLVYDTSLEEQKYLSALTREKVRPPFLAISLKPDVRTSCWIDGETTGESDATSSPNWNSDHHISGEDGGTIVSRGRANRMRYHYSRLLPCLPHARSQRCPL
jgi:hypothetical protein